MWRLFTCQKVRPVNIFHEVQICVHDCWVFLVRGVQLSGLSFPWLGTLPKAPAFPSHTPLCVWSRWTPAHPHRPTSSLMAGLNISKLHIWENADKTHTCVRLTRSGLREMWPGLLGGGGDAASELDCVCHPVVCEILCTEVSNWPVCPARFLHPCWGPLCGGEAARARCSTTSNLSRRATESSCGSYKVAEGTVYFSWSASSKRAANSK